MAENYVVFRVSKIKSFQAMAGRRRHNAREIDVPNADPEKFKENMFIVNHPETFGEFLKNQGVEKIRKNAVLGGEIVASFSADAVPPEQYKAWAVDTMNYIAGLVGKENLFQCVAHADEKSFHIHALFSGVQDGKLRFNEIIRGPKHLGKIQTDYAKHMEKYGLHRGIPKEITKRHHKPVKQFQKELAVKYEELEREKQFLQEQKDTLKAVDSLVNEDIDFRIAVEAKKAELRMQEIEPAGKLIPQKKKSRNLDHDELVR